RLRSSLGLNPPLVSMRDVMRLPAHPPLPVVMMPAPKLELLLVAAGSRRLPLRPVDEVFARIAETHQYHLQQTARIDREYQELQGRMLQALSVSAVAQPVTERRFEREAIEVHASGRISSIFGPQFAEQDEYVRQVRMPAAPLLLVDRVT